ncbi:hypothetical protein ABE61_12535 [Lysinibacillus sphaericus]|uniref:DUF4179 domain-containing protein n=1 Tax=Lysinibacillus sphaericus TaxID=1421 RepID=UPI0018CD14FA|nr:DUF4179 domain-containing protein [Lysinibacillus sphaericus]MBG9454843.1 hypothetical protein [Lysinibacillus sphaericus]MBG9478271.1 hypothetical protein [Lysinibacillus sphaericus]MBG9590984.1 hypothetical protein [Lysinibacillus sphaericus]
MNTRSKQEDKELDQLERLIRETPMEVDLVNRTMSKFESTRYTKRPESSRTSKKMRQRVVMITASTAMILSLIFFTSLVSPTLAATIKHVPVLSSIFKLAGDFGLQTADEKGLSTKLHTSVTHDDFTLNVSEVVYDGTRVSIAIERPHMEGEFSKDTLGDHISNIEFFINGNPRNSFAPDPENSMNGFYIKPGKDNDSAIIEFADERNQGGRPFPKQFDLTLIITITGIQDPLKIDIPVKNKVEDNVTLQPNVSRQYDNIHFTIEKIQLTPITTNLTTRTILTDNSPIAELIMGIDVFDEQGHKLKLNGGLGPYESNGSDMISDHRYTPFESIPKTITLKPYIHLFKEYPKGEYQLDENGEPMIQYIPELEVTLPINSQK